MNSTFTTWLQAQRARDVVVPLILGVALTACGGDVREVRQPDWAGSGTKIVFDHHTHTRFSDGNLSLADLVELSAGGGCEALVISDHSDIDSSYSMQFFGALDAARIAHPTTMIFAGLELEMPSYDGREHLGLTLHPRLERAILSDVGAALKRIALEQDVNEGKTDASVLDVVKSRAPAIGDAIIVYNHPSRKDQSRDENLADFHKWSLQSGRKLLFSGAPGHQAATEPGDYQPPLLTVNRWDPVVAEVGGTWDQLLDRGAQVWGAIAASDFHNQRLDYPPCTFAKTHVTAAAKSYGGMLDALAAGTFWAGHGDMLEKFELTVEVDASLPPAYPGAIVRLTAEDEISLVQVVVERGEGGIGRPLTVEFISNCLDGKPQVFAEIEFGELETRGQIFLPLLSSGADRESCYLRARTVGEREGELLAAYTNPVRLIYP